jgi:hypothetical protein
MPLITPQTGSIIDGPQGQDRTGTAISPNIVIKVGSVPVGAIQRLSLTESRTITMVDELGYDGHIDSVPTKATDISGECTRIRYDLMYIATAFGRDFLHVDAQRIPFDIDIYDNWNGPGSNAVVTTVRNVWIERIGYAYQADNFIIIDDMSFKAESIYSTLNGGNASQGGVRGPAILSIDPIEQATDVGSYRGALTAPGLISDYFTNV